MMNRRRSAGREKWVPVNGNKTWREKPQSVYFTVQLERQAENFFIASMLDCNFYQSSIEGRGSE